MGNVFKIKGIKTGTLITGIFLLIYLPSLLYITFGNTVEKDILKNGKIEVVQNVDGILIRNEKVIDSPDDGNCVMDAVEGEKVPAFYRIATIVKNVPVSTYEELKKKEMQISSAQKAQKENLGVFSGDIIKLDSEIIEKVKKLGQQSIRGSLVESYDTMSDIDSIVYRKSDIFGDNSKSAKYINRLISEKAEIERRLSNNVKEVRVDSAGLISFAIDGYESLLTPNFIKSATPQDLENITVKNTNRDFNVVDVKKGEPIAKIVKDLDNYMVAVVDQKAAKDLTKDKLVTLRINDIGYSMDAVINYNSDVINGKKVISFKYDTGLDETIGMRRINVDVVLSSYSGLKVPRSCLQDININNQTAKICLLKGNTATFKEVKIVGMNDDAAIIDNPDGESSVALYNTYILNPKNVQEGQIID
ncbi:HlyD family efflux transporter periplasmic adaptor subunit [Ruminiclostridium josui]|uniref:HlyD family efflux transporter periplasmic adaptor subunit n=1 Tax=Ruminiclostridium josui TaxID=1499 RepID=UPI000466046C|nr:HlyD family efflux transporter periplasmic adaptor subunit [Ruminiclostridium josui]